MFTILRSDLVLSFKVMSVNSYKHNLAEECFHAIHRPWTAFKGNNDSIR